MERVFKIFDKIVFGLFEFWATVFVIASYLFFILICLLPIVLLVFYIIGY